MTEMKQRCSYYSIVKEDTRLKLLTKFHTEGQEREPNLSRPDADAGYLGEAELWSFSFDQIINHISTRASTCNGNLDVLE